VAGHDFRGDPSRGRRAIQSCMTRRLDTLESFQQISRPDANVDQELSPSSFARHHALNLEVWTYVNHATWKGASDQQARSNFILCLEGVSQVIGMCTM
jgi:hypothetical protein